MIEAYPKVFEEVVSDNDLTVLRLRVPGGFLVVIRDALADQTTTAIYLPNPENNWNPTAE